MYFILIMSITLFFRICFLDEKLICKSKYCVIFFLLIRHFNDLRYFLEYFQYFRLDQLEIM